MTVRSSPICLMSSKRASGSLEEMWGDVVAEHRVRASWILPQKHLDLESVALSLARAISVLWERNLEA